MIPAEAHRPPEGWSARGHALWAALRRWSREIDLLELREPWLVWFATAVPLVLFGLLIHRPDFGVVVALSFGLGRRMGRPARMRKLLPPPPLRPPPPPTGGAVIDRAGPR